MGFWESCLKFFEKWLPIVFGCHQKRERSFIIRGYQFPICARCTGELVGILISPLFFKVPVSLLFVLMLPMIIDGFVQQLTSYESNNIKRFITGVLFGGSLTVLFCLSTVFVFHKGLEVGKFLT